jgi:aspartyl-tRNA(Asn)/glutamyl-tRNA(Gln) amidotransferase subunit A
MIAGGELRAEEYIASLFDRIDRLDPRVHAYLQLDREGALFKARELDARAKRGERLGKLAGMGIAIKDNICVESLQATAPLGSWRVSVLPTARQL